MIQFKRFFKYNYIWVISFLLQSISLQAQDVFNLKHCIELGLERNYELRIIRNEQEISNNNLTLGNAGYLPTLDLNAGYSGSVNTTEQWLTNGGTVKNSGIHNNSLNAGLQMNWMLFDGFKIQADYSKLQELQRKGELNTRLMIEDFISGLTSEYYNYVRQNIRMRNLKAAVTLSRERLRIVEARYNIGSMSRLDLQQARVDFNADSSRYIKQQETLYTSRILLNEMMAVEQIDQPLIIGDTIIEFDPFLNRTSLWEKTLSANSSLLIADKNKTLNRLDYKAIKSRNYPYLKFNAGYGASLHHYERGSYSKQQAVDFNYGFALGFNIFNGFNQKREQKNVRIQMKNIELEYEQLELSLRATLSNIWMAYQNNIELTSLERENLEAAKENYNIALERYKLGDLSGIELREAQNSLLEAEERLLEAEYSTKLCEISLLQISGQVNQYLR